MKYATWATSQLLAPTQFLDQWGISHWSRRFEYPFALQNVRPSPGLHVLDAAGGNGIFQVMLSQAGCKVTNIDSSQKDLDEAASRYRAVPDFLKNVRLELGDLKQIKHPNDAFDRAVCLSVLEHDSDPLAILSELWRVLKPGGRLVCTFDVAGYIRWNHTIDLCCAEQLLKPFGIVPPPPPTDLIFQEFDEIEPRLFDPKKVTLAVLCFYCDKE